MKSFPFDSQIAYDALGNKTYDRGVDSADLAANIALLFTNGVLSNPTNSLKVTPSDSQMSVFVQPGGCCINGRLGKEDDVRTIVFEASDTNYDRIDRVVLRLNTNVDARAIDIYVKKGTASDSPVAKSLTRTGGIYELGIADVFIPKNSTLITESRITDTRLVNELCGLMTTNPQSVDAATLFKEYTDALDKQFKTALAGIDSRVDTIADESSRHNKALNARIDDLAESTQNQIENTNRFIYDLDESTRNQIEDTNRIIDRLAESTQNQIDNTNGIIGDLGESVNQMISSLTARVDIIESAVDQRQVAPSSYTIEAGSTKTINISSSKRFSIAVCNGLQAANCMVVGESISSGAIRVNGFTSHYSVESTPGALKITNNASAMAYLYITFYN